MRRTRVLSSVVAAALLATVASCQGEPAAVPAPRGGYVALGDSYVAGPGIPASTGAPLGCGRSTNNYPSLVDAEGRYSGVVDASCAGATLADLTGSQPTRAGTNPPQLDALAPDTALVTLTIGGNDIGFNEIVTRCLDLSRRAPDGAACRASYARGGRDVLADRVAAVAPGLASVLTRIRRTSPGATVLLVGYPTILPSGTGSCDQAPFSAADMSYLDDVFHALNGVLEREAVAAGAHFVDTAAAGVGHDVCRSADLRWVEGEQPSSPAAPFHPNVDGMRATAAQVRGAALLS